MNRQLSLIGSFLDSTCWIATVFSFSISRSHLSTMSGSDAPTLTTLRRRGVVRASITRLATRLSEIEPRAHETTSSLAHRMSTKLETLDSNFKIHHLAVIDTLTKGDEDGLAKEEILDAHDDEVASLTSCIKYLLQICSSLSESGTRSITIGEHYAKAIECLKSRYSRPRLIHQTHVCKICEVPPLKEGTGKELRRFYDILQQHLRALKAMGHEPSGSFTPQ